MNIVSSHTTEKLTKLDQLNELYELDINNSSLTKAIRKLDDFMRLDAKNHMRCFSLTGESGVGKTHAIKIIEQRFADKNILSFTVGSGGTDKSLAQNLLKEMGDDNYKKSKQTKAQLLERVVDALQSYDILIFDEAQQLSTSPSKREQYDTADFIKSLVDRISCHVIFVGLPYLADLFRSNDGQLERRIRSKAKLIPYVWDGGQQTKEYAYALSIIQGQLPAESTCLLRKDVCKAICYSSGGRISQTIRLIEEAARNMIHDSRDSLVISDLERAYEDLYENSNNPFSYLRDMGLAA